MPDVTKILQSIDRGEAGAAERLLPLVYQELRGLAAARMAAESPDHTLQATALVHEAYLRLVDTDQAQRWNSRGHFFAAAAEAMRRILVENARRKRAIRNGGGRTRQEIVLSELASPFDRQDVDENLLALDAALDALQRVDAAACELVKLRYFTGLTVSEAAEVLGVSPRQADFLWSFARAWLRREFDA